MEVARGVTDENPVSAPEDVLCAGDVSGVENVLRAGAVDPAAANGIEGIISDSGTDSSMFSLLLALSVAADPNRTVSGDRDTSSTAVPQPIAVPKKRKKKSGIGKRKDGRSGKVTDNRGLPPTKQTSKPKASCEKSTSKDIILIQELREKLFSAGDLNKKLLKDNKVLEKNDLGAQRTVQNMKHSCDIKIAKADELVQQQRDRVSSTQDNFAKSLKKNNITTKKKSIVMEKKKIEKEKQHELALGSLEVSYQTEKEKAESDRKLDMEYMEAILLKEREHHKAEVERLMRVMNTRQEEDESKVKALFFGIENTT